MRYIQTTGWEDGIADLTARLISELATGKKILWLVSGGSNVSGSIQIIDSISEELTTNLSITLIDERYGAIGHPESNWQKFLNAGFIPKNAEIYEVLKPGQNLEQTAANLEEFIEEKFASVDLVLAQLGIGPDGHIAGILPESKAALEEIDLVTSYAAEDFKRVTLTFPGIQKIDAAYAFAFGDGKHDALTNLQLDSFEAVEQPAQILKQLPEAYIYSDQIGDK